MKKLLIMLSTITALALLATMAMVQAVDEPALVTALGRNGDREPAYNHRRHGSLMNSSSFRLPVPCGIEEQYVGCK